MNEFPPGARVVVRGDRWTVTGTDAHQGCTSVQLYGCGAANGGVRRTLLSPFDRIQRIDHSGGIRVVRPRRWLHALRRLGAASHPFGGLRAVPGGIEILPYQLAPALAIAAGATRVMIADAVGLGKTVQAGLILNELASTGVPFRALVATPAGLREQWAGELEKHFSLPAIIAGSAWLARMGRELPLDINPWILPGIYVTSFDFLKRPEVLRPLEDVTWDTLVVDEAHNASAGTARRAAVHAVAMRSRRVILLTATPHAGDAQQYEALCRIGDAGPASPIVIFRRSREDAGSARPRRSVLLQVRLSPAERRMHRLLDNYTARVCREAGAGGDQRARLAAIVLRKRALSSAASLAASTAKRLALLSGLSPIQERQLPLPLGDEDHLADEEPDAILATPGLKDLEEERALLGRVGDAAAAASRLESKLRTLTRFLTRAREPAIVFTEYRDTLVRLERALEAAGLRTCAIHGGQSPAERAAIQRAFNEQGSLLLATDAAAEGLNLHSRCRLVIHYELPWSPARLEQRTGRVDRIGQRRRVHEMLFVARDTAERLVLAPLVRRAIRARSALPGGSSVLALLTESRIADAVLDGVSLDDDPSSSSPACISSPAEGAAAEREAVRLRTIRDWNHHAPSDQQIGPFVSLIRRQPALRGATCIFAVSLASPDGRVQHRELVAMHDRDASRLRSAAAGDARRAFAQWTASRGDLLRREAASIAGPGLTAAIARYRDAVSALEQRERATVRARPSVSRQLVQAGLFDNRAVRAHQERRQSAGALLEESESRISALGWALDLTLTVKLAALLWHGHAAGGRR